MQRTNLIISRQDFDDDGIGLGFTADHQLNVSLLEDGERRPGVVGDAAVAVNADVAAAVAVAVVDPARRRRRLLLLVVLLPSDVVQLLELEVRHLLVVNKRDIIYVRMLNSTSFDRQKQLGQRSQVGE